MLFQLFNGISSGAGVDFKDVMIHLAVILMMIFLILPVHEFAHAGVAYLLGDKDIKYRGRLSLNPLIHIDTMGALCMLLFGFGWAKSVPVNPNRFKYPKLYMGICALAGPVANILCGMLGGAILLLIYNTTPAALIDYTFYGAVHLTELGEIAWNFLTYYISINAVLAVFNMIPIPPLDGSKVLFVFLPNHIVNTIYRYQQYTFIAIFALLYLGVLDPLINTGASFIMNLSVFFKDIYVLF